MVWLTEWLVLWIAAKTALADPSQQCPQKDFMTDFNMTKVSRMI
jgi:hypothetical protein